MAENNLLPNSHNDTTSECDEDAIVTMVDVLKAEETLEENADAVLGAGDDKNCTYSEGYLKRQALYSCLTCLPADGPDRAGLCLACSYHCHADHELVELYTKRNFRCDCGNSLFKGRNCTLDPLKSSINEKNLYNQNFRGVYCTCSRPYPDDENSVEDTMIQCIICEDWFHTRHLGSTVPNYDGFSEMICGSCTDKLPFLQYYLGYTVKGESKSEAEDDDKTNVSVTEADSKTNVSVTEADSKTNVSVTEADSKTNVSVTEADSKTKVSVTENATPLNSSQELVNGEVSVANETSVISLAEDKAEAEDKKCLPQKTSDAAEETKEKEMVSPDTTDLLKETDVTASAKETESKTIDVENGCKLKNLKMLPRDSGAATYWQENFRKLLCTCSSCKEVYESHGLPFMTDENDTIRVYEEEGKARKKSGGTTQYERSMEALSSLDRVQQVEAILSYNEMKTHLSEYLAKFAENKKVVREEDIREFFTGMQARKRQKVDIPHHCR